MALTQEQIISVCISTFDAAPGAANLANLEAWAASNPDAGLVELAEALGALPEFAAQFDGMDTAAKAEAMAARFGLSAGTDGGDAAIAYFTQEIEAGTSDATMLGMATDFLLNSDADTLAGFGLTDAATVLANKTAVAKYYSVDKALSGDTIADLQAIVADVTADAATVTSAQADVDAAVEAANSASTGITGSTLRLTTGIDTLTGTDNDDIFNGNETIVVDGSGTTTYDTVTALDKISGGNGEDMLNIQSTSAINLPGTIEVSEVEILNLETASTVTADTSSTFTGLKTINSKSVGATTLTAGETTDINATVTATGAIAIDGGNDINLTTKSSVAAGAVTIGGTTVASGDVVVNQTNTSTAGATAGAISVNGGDTISVTQTSSNAVNTTVTDGAVTISGSASTTSVSVTADKATTASATVVGHVNGAVSVTDVNAASATDAGTITTVSLTNFAAASVNSGALSTLNLSGTGTSVNAGTLGALTTAAIDTLAVNVNDLTTTGAVTVDTDIETLNIDSSTAKSTIASLVANGAKTINVSGDAALTLTATTVGALEKVAITNTAGVAFGSVANTVDFSGGAGDDSATFGATTKDITMGAGDDTVTLTSAVGASGTIDAGDGTDTLVVADGDFVTSTTDYVNFEVVDLKGAAAGTLDMDYLSTVTKVTVSAPMTASLTTLNDVAAGTDLEFVSVASTDTDTTGTLTYNLKDATGTSDSLDITLKSVDTDTNGGDIDGELTLNDLTAAGIETINIVSSASTTDVGTITAGVAAEEGEYTNTITTLTVANAKTIDVSGAADLTITTLSDAALTKFDASDATGDITVTLSSPTSALGYLGSAGVDTVVMTGNGTENNVIQGNGGADDITLAAAGTKETVKIASDTDSVLTLVDTTSPVVTPVVMDVAKGYDTVTTFTTGEDKIELSAALGLGTGDARTAITGKGTIGDGAIANNAELAADLQTLIDDGVAFFNDGTTDRAVAQVIVDDATDATVLFIDTNADGDFTNSTDQAIYLTGLTTGLDINDIVFG
ncbi:beta strand repeat-containing protein [Sulfurospirillum sp. 1307]